jgi:aquaporin NIP
MNKLLSELLGTFILVFAGTGAIVINDVSGGVIGHAGIALTFGLVVMAMIYTYGDVSGAHLNPAVTLGFRRRGRFEWKDVPGYVLAQIGGACLASGVLRLLFPTTKNSAPRFPVAPRCRASCWKSSSPAILMLAILRVSTGAKEKGITAGIAIGGVIALEAMFAGPICGASMNPARSLAPALVSGHVEHLWVYLTATVLGAVTAVPLAKAVEPSPS